MLILGVLHRAAGVEETSELPGAGGYADSGQYTARASTGTAEAGFYARGFAGGVLLAAVGEGGAVVTKEKRRCPQVDRETCVRQARQAARSDDEAREMAL